MTPRFKDETGKWYGKLRVLRFDGIRNGQAYWICKCWCGREVSVRGANLRSGNTTTCGSCSRQKKRRGKMRVQTINHVWVMRKYDPRDRSKSALWLFFCSWCGRGGEASERQIRGGKALLCECLRPTYYSWRKMIERCTSKNHAQYKDYGGRGITVCQRWRDSFSDFVTDMKPRPNGKTLDRYPNADGNYEPGNCRWATPEEQAAHRRKRERNAEYPA